VPEAEATSGGPLLQRARAIVATRGSNASNETVEPSNVEGLGLVV